MKVVSRSILFFNNYVLPVLKWIVGIALASYFLLGIVLPAGTVFWKILSQNWFRYLLIYAGIVALLFIIEGIKWLYNAAIEKALRDTDKPS
jgi:hypothetical protein